MLNWDTTTYDKYTVGSCPKFNLSIAYIGDSDFDVSHYVVLWDNSITQDQVD
ncbi:hypothetical protein DPMN_189844 [Dreissena polymorpha]|uniref:Uncharacterized protein n=1 Tax=Dreissena polymorpha TaxID=45954 RepID=A0A9D4ICJ8_DREPO|nr:hypothetical protein DPMN_189828 [Dreissena polymorpha]KAH3755157.1 hypothetical protein DPMN_189844 [Dreissena polymorpha]